MVFRGENVGTAYIRIVADGSGLDRSIREEFEKHEDGFHQAGRKNSEAFNEGFDEQMERWAPKHIKGLVAGMNRKSGQMDATARQMADGFMQPLRDQLVYRHGPDIGGRLAKQLERGFIESGGDLDWVDNFVENIEKHISAATEKIQSQKDDALFKQRLDRDREFEAHVEKLHQESLDRRIKMDEEFERNAARLLEVNLAHNEAFWKEMEDRDRDWERKHSEAAKNAADAERRNTDALKQKAQAIRKSLGDYKALIYEIDRMDKGLSTDRSRKELIRDLGDLRVNMHNFGTETLETRHSLDDYDKRLMLMHPRMNKFSHGIDRVADGFGRAFGKGSRNNFVNALGSLADGIVRTANVVPMLYNGITNIWRRFEDAEGAGAKFGSLLKDVGKIAGGLGGVLGGAFFVVGPMISLLSQALGAALALASTIGFGLAGAAGALAGSLLPAASAIGVLIIGMHNLDGEAKKSAQGILDSFKDLGKVAGEGLMFDRSTIDADHQHTVHSFAHVLDKIKGMVDDLKPLTRQVGRAVADSMDMFVTKIGGAGGAWDKFIEAMSKSSNKHDMGWLAVESRKVGRILGEAFGGMLGTFRALMPVTDRFLTWLRDLTVRYRKWINSGEGQEKMVDFFDRAGDSAADLGDFLLAATKLLGTLMSGGKDSGDSLFDSMTDSINKWNDALKTAGGQDALKQWFEDSADFARDLGDVLVNVVKLMDKLDTEASRSEINFFFESLSNVLGIINGVLSPIIGAFTKLNDATGGLSGNLTAALLIFPRLNSAFADSTGKISTFASDLRNAETRAGTMKSALRGLAGAGGLMLLADAAHRGGGAMGTLEGAAGGAMAGFAIGGPWGAAIGGAAGALLPLISNTKDAAAAQDELVASTQEVIGTLNQQTGALTARSRVLVTSKLQEDGWLSRAKEMHLNLGAMTKATMQGSEAIQRFRLHYIQSLPQDQRAAFVDLTNQMFHLNDSLFNGQKAWSLQREAMGKTGAAAQRMREHVQRLSEKYNLIPKELRTIVSEFGATPTIKKVRALAAKYDLMPKQVRSIIGVLGDEPTKKKVAKVIAALKEANRQHPNPKIDADTEGGTKKITSFMDLINGLPGVGRKQNATAKLLADATSANREVDKTKTNLRTLISGDYTARVKADTTAANFSIDNLNSRLTNIRDQTVYVDVYTRNHGKGGPPTATGGLFNYAQQRLIGEAGPEAVVPLNRPLGQVDPAVRWLSAIAQGKTAMASGGVVGGGRTVDVGGITVISPSADPKAVAVQMMNQLVAAVI